MSCRIEFGGLKCEYQRVFGVRGGCAKDTPIVLFMNKILFNWFKVHLGLPGTSAEKLTYRHPQVLVSFRFMLDT
jgi:hypothetical protein